MTTLVKIQTPEYFDTLFPSFQNHLRTTGVAESVVKSYIGPAKHFIVWLEQSQTPLSTVDANILRQFLEHECQCIRPAGEHYQHRMSNTNHLRNIINRFIQYLEQAGYTPTPEPIEVGFQHIEDFIAHLTDQSLAAGTCAQYRYTCNHFIYWIHGQRILLSDITLATITTFEDHSCDCPGMFGRHGQNAGQMHRVKRFYQFLLTRCVITAKSELGHKVGKKLEAFQGWLQQNRGIKTITIEAHVRVILSILPDLGNDPGQYTAAHLKQVILNNMQGRSRSYAKHLTISLRMYLRFLASTQQCSASLVNAVPSIPQWRLSVLPRYILHEEAERVIDACDQTTPTGLRNRAILLLLYRLALRAGDVFHLCLSDIDWDNAILRVSGKSGITVGLPLPQDVGEAILAYIEQGRPNVGTDRLFLRVVPPYKEFSCSTAISTIVRGTLIRAGVDSPIKGAYVFRHSAATHMLREGVPLETISTLLRHKSLDTTTIYAKVDMPMLQSVAQAWIGDEV